MNILPNGQINHELTLVDILFGKRANNVPDSNKTLNSRRDTVVISDEARDMAVPKTSGCKLNELTEKDGTYYTKDGMDILDLVDAAISKSDAVAGSHKGMVKEWIHELVSETAKHGWNNVRDMKLSILFTANGLADLYQSIQYGSGKPYENGKAWYSVL